jgi:acetylornithine deacetylase/succinyl-diaminopimelate desuccinylase-like protein
MVTARFHKGSKMRSKTAAAALIAACLAHTVPMGAAAGPRAETGEPAFRAILKEMVETDTSFETGDCTVLARKVEERMKAAGFPAADLRLLVPPSDPKAGALVAIYPGRNPKLKPVLMVGHIDVVNARRADWTRDPFTLLEEGGYLYGRGVADMKGQDAIWVDNLLRYRADGYRPLRTIKMALTCGEEGSFLNGAKWLVDNHRELIDAGIALNEGGYGELDDKGNRIDQTFQAAQKVVMGFTLEATNPGGHSSLPRPDNAIYGLARALDRVSRYEFPVQFIDANRSYFTRMAKVVPGAEGAAMAKIIADPTDVAANALLNRSPSYHSMLRTTCVATMLAGGHAANALPQRATATINCRVIPGVPIEEVTAALVKAVDDPQVTVTPGRNYRPMQPARITSKVLGPVERVAATVWPNVPVVPHMAPGATDAVSLTPAGIPTYGVTGIFRDPDGNGVHGLNERLRVRSLMEARTFLYALVKAYADQPD